MSTTTEERRRSSPFAFEAPAPASVSVATAPPSTDSAVAIAVQSTGELNPLLEFDRQRLLRLGFTADAEGRLVMCDALELAAEENSDAIVDIATLTGSCARALGADIAGLFGTVLGGVRGHDAVGARRYRRHRVE